MPPVRTSGVQTLKAKIESVARHEDGMYFCEAEEKCTYFQKKFIPRNFARHIAAFHPKVYNLLELGDAIPEEENRRKIAKSVDPEDYAMVKISRNHVVGGVIKLVTKHGLPYQCLAWEGMRDILEHQLAAFKMSLTSRNIQQLVGHVRNNIDEIVKNEVRDQMLSLKYDIVTKRNRSMLGVNVQFFKNTDLCKRTLGMIELHKRHTGITIKDTIHELLRSFHIDPRQLYTATVDNARNVVAAVRELRELQRVCREPPEDKDNQEENADDSFVSFEYDDSDDEDDSSEIINIEEFSKLAEQHEIVCVRCGAHTFNLVVTDATRDALTTISEIVGIVKSYRRAEYKDAFKLNQQKYPPVPNATRWSPFTDSMQALLAGREFFDRLATSFPALDLSTQWDFIIEYTQAFTPLRNAIIRVQALDCPLSQLYIEWLQVKMHVDLLPEENHFRNRIKDSMTTREKTIFSNDAYRAAFYMDPRLMYHGSKLLSPVERENTIEYLLKIWASINQLKHVEPLIHHQQELQPGTSKSINTDAYIELMFGESSSTNNQSSTLDQELRNIQFQQRQSAMDVSFNPVKYWFKHKMVDNRLWEIAKVVYTAASTQVSVERDNSYFNLIFTPLRNSISEKNLENVLQVKLNEHIIDAAISLTLKQQNQK